MDDKWTSAPGHDQAPSSSATINLQMPYGDAQRTWFPEMVAELRRRWRPDLSLPELIELRNEFDAMLHRVRSARHLHTPVIRCRRCGHIGPAAEPEISVRSMIIALGRFGIASAEEAKALEKCWAAHRKAHALDLHGKPAVPATASTALCGH